MGYFRLEEHLQRHQELLDERDHDRLVYLATEADAVKPAKSIGLVRGLIAWLRIRISVQAEQPAAQPKIEHRAVRSSPRPLVE